MRQFLDPYDTKLNTFSRELSPSEITRPEIKSIIRDMRDIAIGEQCNAIHPDMPSLSGLAAPQIGEFIRIILVDTAADATKTNPQPIIRFFINPKIMKISDAESPMREGCYSTDRICGAVMRPKWVLISALDENGQEVEFRANNIFQSHVIQHEIDHLNGIRFPSRIRNSQNLHYVEKEDFQNYRENWMTWDKRCSFEDWLKMYEGKDDG